jgi:hypothetical protein
VNVVFAVDCPALLGLVTVILNVYEVLAAPPVTATLILVVSSALISERVAVTE